MARKKTRKKQGKKRKSVRMHNAIVQIRIVGRSTKKKRTKSFVGPKLPKGFNRAKAAIKSGIEEVGMHMKNAMGRGRRYPGGFGR